MEEKTEQRNGSVKIQGEVNAGYHATDDEELKKPDINGTAFSGTHTRSDDKVTSL